MTDDDIMASIIAGAETCGRSVRAEMTFGTGDEHGPTCAVGAGLLYRGVDLSEMSGSGDEPINLFAEYYGVSRSTAIGISDGFEWRGVDDRGVRGYVHSLFDGRKRGGKDYARGWAIGAAIRSAVEEVA